MRMSTFRYSPAGWRFWVGILGTVVAAMGFGYVFVYVVLTAFNILAVVWMALGGS